MRCYICNSIIDHPVWDDSIKNYAPCPACEDEVLDLVLEWEAEAEDDAFEDDDPEESA